MRATKSLEYIGENSDAYARTANKMAKRVGVDLGIKSNRPWIARITGTDPTYGLARTFLEGQIDYSQANSVGSRGVYLHFFLEDGVYEVSEHVSWKRTRRYFIVVHNIQVSEIPREEVLSYLDQVSTSPTKELKTATEESVFLNKKRTLFP